MKRTLRNDVLSAVLRTWDPAGGDPHTGAVAVLLTFPPQAFGPAPSWDPGPGFRVCRDDESWIRETPEETTMLVAGVAAPLRVADAAGPDEPEVWTVTVPAGGERPAFLWDEPGRIADYRCAALGAEVTREPLAGHPSAAAVRHWAEFERQWGFRPRRHLPDGSRQPGDRWRLLLPCLPALLDHPNERELVDAAALLLRRFGAKAQARLYSPAGPAQGHDDEFTVHRILAAAAGLT